MQLIIEAETMEELENKLFRALGFGNKFNLVELQMEINDLKERLEISAQRAENYAKQFLDLKSELALLRTNSDPVKSSSRMIPIQIESLIIDLVIYFSKGKNAPVGVAIHKQIRAITGLGLVECKNLLETGFIDREAQLPKGFDWISIVVRWHLCHFVSVEDWDFAIATVGKLTELSFDQARALMETGVYN